MSPRLFLRRRSGRAARRRGRTHARSPLRCTPASRRCARIADKFRRPVRKIALNEAVEADVARIEAAWAFARKTFGKAGPFLFGRFSAADAMYAPVVTASMLRRSGFARTATICRR